MYSYIPVSVWGMNEAQKQVATIDELLALCKSGDVARVIIPMTYYGYGSTIVDESNLRSIQKAFKRNRLKTYQYSLTMSAWQFIHNEELREMVEQLQEQYVVFSDDDHSQLESEYKFKACVDELFYTLLTDDAYDDLSKDEIEEVLLSGEWDTRIEWWNLVQVANDGYTIYISKEDAKILKAKFLERRKAMEQEQ